MPVKDDEDDRFPKWGRDQGWTVCKDAGFHPLLCEMCRHQQAHLKEECREAHQECVRADLRVIPPRCKPC